MPDVLQKKKRLEYRNGVPVFVDEEVPAPAPLTVPDTPAEAAIRKENTSRSAFLQGLSPDMVDWYHRATADLMSAAGRTTEAKVYLNTNQYRQSPAAGPTLEQELGLLPRPEQAGPTTIPESVQAQPNLADLNLPLPQSVQDIQAVKPYEPPVAPPPTSPTAVHGPAGVRFLPPPAQPAPDLPLPGTEPPVPAIPVRPTGIGALLPSESYPLPEGLVPSGGLGQAQVGARVNREARQAVAGLPDELTMAPTISARPKRGQFDASALLDVVRTEASKGGSAWFLGKGVLVDSLTSRKTIEEAQEDRAALLAGQAPKRPIDPNAMKFYELGRLAVRGPVPENIVEKALGGLANFAATYSPDIVAALMGSGGLLGPVLAPAAALAEHGYEEGGAPGAVKGAAFGLAPYGLAKVTKAALPAAASQLTQSAAQTAAQAGLGAGYGAAFGEDWQDVTAMALLFGIPTAALEGMRLKFEYDTASSKGPSAEAKAKAFSDLGLDPATATEGDVSAAYRQAAKTAHPDVGGSTKAFTDLTEAYLTAKRTARSGPRTGMPAEPVPSAEPTPTQEAVTGPPRALEAPGAVPEPTATLPVPPQAGAVAPVQAPKPVAPAVYAGHGFGEAEGYAGAGAGHDLYNLTEDIPGHPKGSTLTGQTLEEAGYMLPAIPKAAVPPPVTAPVQPPAAPVAQPYEDILQPPPAPIVPRESTEKQKAYTDWLGQVILKFKQEEHGQAILDGLEESGKTPQQVVQEFWTSTYPKLPEAAQKRFQQYITKVTSFKPGSTIGVDREGNAIIGKDWPDLYNTQDVPSNVEHLEGTERGLIALMEIGNQRAKTGQPAGVPPIGQVAPPPAPTQKAEPTHIERGPAGDVTAMRDPETGMMVQLPKPRVNVRVQLKAALGEDAGHVRKARKLGQSAFMTQLTPETAGAIKQKTGLDPQDFWLAVNGKKPVGLPAVAPQEPGILPHELDPVTTPRHLLPAADSAEIMNRAESAKMLVEMGEPGKRSGYLDPDLPKEIERVNTSTHSTYPAWYADLGLTREAALKAIDKIIEDKGKDVGGPVERVKELLLVNRKFAKDHEAMQAILRKPFGGGAPGTEEGPMPAPSRHPRQTTMLEAMGLERPQPEAITGEQTALPMAVDVTKAIKATVPDLTRSFKDITAMRNRLATSKLTSDQRSTLQDDLAAEHQAYRAVLDHLESKIGPKETAKVREQIETKVVPNRRDQGALEFARVQGESGTKAVAGFDPRLVKVLGGNLYSGDLGVTAMKEMLQNAVDSVRALPNSAKSGTVTIAVTANNITVSDNGPGMLPDVATTELVDIGGSKKAEGSSGGFGIAKVAIFSNSQHIHITTIAKEPGTGKTITTTLTGSGEDWLDASKGLNVETSAVKAGTKTGTRISVDLANDASLHMKAWLELFVATHRLPMKIEATFNGAKLIGENWEIQRAGPLKEIGQVDFAGGTMTILASKHAGETAVVHVKVLNRGLPQFTQEIYLGRSLPMPRVVVADISASAGPEEANYPFSPDRERLRDSAQTALTHYVEQTLGKAAANTQLDVYRKAMDRAPGIEGSEQAVYDTGALYPDKELKRIATAPYMRGLNNGIAAAFGELQRVLSKGKEAMMQARYAGIGLGDKYLAVNINGRALTGVDGTPNQILINPYTILYDITKMVEHGYIDDTQIHAVYAKQIVTSIIHELTHQQHSGHSEDFSSALTTNNGHVMDEASVLAAQLTETISRAPTTEGAMGLFDDTTINQIRADLDELRKAWKKGNDIFDQIAVHAARQRGIGSREGHPLASRASGLRPKETLPVSRKGAAIPLESAPTVRGTVPENITAPPSTLGGERGSVTGRPVPIPQPAVRAIAAMRESAVAKWYKENFQPELVSDEAMLADPLFAKMRAAKAQERDAVLRQGEEAHAFWTKIPEAERLDFLDHLEQGKVRTGNAEYKALATRYRAALDQTYKDEKALGSKADFVTNYLPHLWKDPAKARMVFEHLARPQNLGPTWFEKARLFDFIKEGRDAGLELITTNPEELVARRLMAGADFKAHMDLITQLEGMDLAVKVKDVPRSALPTRHQEILPGMKAGAVATNRAHQIRLQEGWFTVKAPNQEDYLLSPDVKALWTNAVEAKGLWQHEGAVGSVFRGWMAFKNVWVPIKLAMSAFHPLHVLHINYSNYMAAAANSLWRGDRAGLETNLSAMMNLYPRTGREARAAWATPRAEQTPAQKQIVDLMTDGGFSAQLSEELRIKGRRGLQEAIAKQEWVKVLPLAVRRAIEIVQAPIFEKWIPNLKTSAYLHAAADLARRRPDIMNDATQRGLALRAIAKSIDNRYGEMFYATTFWNRVVKDAGIGSFLSLGWNLGFVREFGGAAQESVTRPAGAIPMFKPSPARETVREATNKISFVLAYVTTAMLINAMMNEMFADEGEKLPHGWDFVFPRVGGKNPDGSPRRITNMFYTREIGMAVKHVQERGGNVLTGLGAMIWNKTMLEPFKEIAENRNYYGYDIWDVNAPWYKQTWQFVQHTISDQINPITITSAKRALMTGGTWAKDVPLAMAGFGPAPAYAERTALENRITFLYHRHVAPEARPEEVGVEAEKFIPAINAIKAARRMGDAAALDRAREDAKAAGMTPHQIATIGKLPSAVIMFSHLPAYDQRALLKQATDEERPPYLAKAHKDVKREWRLAHPEALSPVLSIVPGEFY